jgi:hypothetical protein
MGTNLDWTANPEAPPGNGRLQIGYAATLLSAPDRIQYSYKLEGLDPDWVVAGRRRTVNYDNLRHGHYRFLVRAELPGAPVSEGAWQFDLLPHFYETLWFRFLLVSLLKCGRMGCLSVASQSDPLPFRAGAAGARETRQRNPRHASAGVRRHLFSTGRR